MQVSLRYFTYITILTLLTIRVAYTENTITQLLTIQATYTTNNTILKHLLNIQLLTLYIDFEEGGVLDN